VGRAAAFRAGRGSSHRDAAHAHAWSPSGDCGATTASRCGNSIVGGYLKHESLAASELQVERFMINVALIRVIYGIFTLDESYGVYLLIGGALYLAGTIGLTMAYHLPRNNALEAADPSSADAAELWRRYLAEWTRWNHARVAAG
jgi:Anthrone oxygenase